MRALVQRWLLNKGFNKLKPGTIPETTLKQSMLTWRFQHPILETTNYWSRYGEGQYNLLLLMKKTKLWILWESFVIDCNKLEIMIQQASCLNKLIFSKRRWEYIVRAGIMMPLKIVLKWSKMHNSMPSWMILSVRSREILINLKWMLGVLLIKEIYKLLVKYSGKQEIGKIV